MMKKTIKFLSIVLTMVMVMMICSLSVSAEQRTSNRFNVVFVLDASGSMKDTDPNDLRFDATKLFLGLLANDGNYVGSVVFSTDIIKTTDIKFVNGTADKNSIESDIESCKVGGWTGIGTALDKGVDMLNDKGNKDLPSVIILLSDGKSELGNDDDLKECNELKAKAINNARKNNIKIYTVGLNSDGEADINELKQISDATYGKCEEVKSAADLKNVFAEFYNLIYGTSTTVIFEGKVPTDGKINKNFKIPDAGVEEVNIIISSKSSINNIRLDKPSGEKMSVDDVKKITTASKSFSITKITKPEGGEWTLYAEGKAGDDVKIEMVYNDCLSIATEYNENDKFVVGDKIQVKGYLFNNDEKATSGYEDYKAILHLTKQTSDNEEDNVVTELDMSVDETSYIAEIPIDEIGTYSMYMQVVGNGIEKKTDENPIIINVGNSAPVVNKDKIEQHFWVIPFITDTGDIDISGAVTDAEDSKLSYSVESSSFKDTSYKLDGETLTMTDFYDLSEGSFTIKATDSNGASAEFEVDVTTTNVGIVTLIVLGIIALIVLAAIGVVTWILLNKRFMGDCYASSFNYETGECSDEVKRSKGRGRIRMTAFNMRVPGLNLSKCYLQATGKDYIYFCSKKPVYGDGSKKKKVKINGLGNEVTIMADANSQMGLRVKFVSRKNKNNFF